MNRAIITTVCVLLLMGFASVSLAGTVVRTGTIVCMNQAGQVTPDCGQEVHSVGLDAGKDGLYTLVGDKGVLDNLAKRKDRTGVTVTGEVKKGRHHPKLTVEKVETP